MVMASNVNSDDFPMYNNLRLCKDDLSVYYFEHTPVGRAKITKVDVDNTGFDIESIDKTIDNQNKNAEDLFFSLKP